MRPNSRFLNDLSQRAEADFKKYAIRSKVDNAWMSVRLLCDARATMSPGVPAGRACVKNAQRMVGRLAFGGGLYSFLGVVAGYIPVAGEMISDSCVTLRGQTLRFPVSCMPSTGSGKKRAVTATRATGLFT